MTPFKPASVSEEEKAITIKSVIEQWRAGRPEFRNRFACETEEEAVRLITEHASEMHTGTEYFINDIYQVARRIQPVNFCWLSVKRLDRQPIHDWRHLQQIKNELMGPECEAVELFPAESRLCDTANQYHIFGFMDPTFRFPFGFDSPRLVFDDSIGKSVNRKFTPA